MVAGTVCKLLAVASPRGSRQPGFVHSDVVLWQWEASFQESRRFLQGTDDNILKKMPVRRGVLLNLVLMNK